MAQALPLKAPTFAIYPHQNIAQAATDRLGKLQAELAPLKNEEAALKAILRNAGAAVVEGDLFRATITPGKSGQSIDWEGLARAVCSDARLAKLLPGFTKTTAAPAATVKVVARKGV